ncbi:gastrin/cholecystokinin-like peptide [Cottoperca gobio]|uniref:Gastrin/cholecystokinin-like peptide n=1 Tax=Cottoperca gobio TaxID=56716 RepID=A0A6J2QG79_COTGO|nr:gastrin/cholecystokinin-like peptide [Cottoperca gobio]
MSGKVVMVFALLVALLVSSAVGEAKENHLLQQLLAKRSARDSAGRQEPVPQAPSARLERRAHLSEDEREIMTKQIMQAISEMKSECLSDRDYQGWVDFGRRDAE